MTAKRFTHVSQFTSDNVLFAGTGKMGDAAENSNTNIDCTCPYDLCITGAVMLVKGGAFGDKCSLQVVHPVAGVLSEFVTDWGVSEDAQKQFELQLDYPANLPAGLIIRLVYKADANAGTRKVTMNYLLHKVLQQEA